MPNLRNADSSYNPLYRSIVNVFKGAALGGGGLAAVVAGVEHMTQVYPGGVLPAVAAVGALTGAATGIAYTIGGVALGR